MHSKNHIFWETTVISLRSSAISSATSSPKIDVPGEDFPQSGVGLQGTRHLPQQNEACYHRRLQSNRTTSCTYLLPLPANLGITSIETATQSSHLSFPRRVRSNKDLCRLSAVWPTAFNHLRKSVLLSFFLSLVFCFLRIISP